MNAMNAVSEAYKKYLSDKREDTLMEIMGNNYGNIVESLGSNEFATLFFEVTGSKSKAEMAKTFFYSITNHSALRNVRLGRVVGTALGKTVLEQLMSESMAKVRKNRISATLLFFAFLMVQPSEALKFDNNNLVYNTKSVWARAEMVASLDPLEEMLNQLKKVKFDELRQAKHENIECFKNFESNEKDLGDKTVYRNNRNYYYQFRRNGQCFFTFHEKILNEMQRQTEKVKTAVIYGDRAKQIIPSLNKVEHTEDCYYFGDLSNVNHSAFSLESQSGFYGCQEMALSHNKQAWSYHFLSNQCLVTSNSTVVLTQALAIAASHLCEVQTGLGKVTRPSGCQYLDIKLKELRFTCPAVALELEAKLNTTMIEIQKYQISLSEEIITGVRNGTLMSQEETEYVKSLMRSKQQSLQIKWDAFGKYQGKFKALMEIQKEFNELCGPNFYCYKNQTGIFQLGFQKVIIEETNVLAISSGRITKCRMGECENVMADHHQPMTGLDICTITTGPEGRKIFVIKFGILGKVRISNQSLAQFHNIIRPQVVVIDECHSVLFEDILIKAGLKHLQCQIGALWADWNVSSNSLSNIDFLSKYNWEIEIIELISIISFMGIFLIKIICQKFKSRMINLDDTRSSWTHDANPLPANETSHLMMIPSNPAAIHCNAQ